MKKLLLILLLLILQACASTGFYNMSDDWCDAHPHASSARCTRDQALTIIKIEPVHAPAAVYPTLEEAAYNAFLAIAAKPTAPFYEWGGVITHSKDGYSFGDPVTDYEGDHVAVDEFGADGPVAAEYHTHPCLLDHDVEYFSPADLVTAIYYHHTVLMGDFCTGHIHEFIPGDKPDAERAEDDPDNIWLTKGRIIGRFTAPHGPVVTK